MVGKAIGFNKSVKVMLPVRIFGTDSLRITPACRLLTKVFLIVVNLLTLQDHYGNKRQAGILVAAERLPDCVCRRGCTDYGL